MQTLSFTRPTASTKVLKENIMDSLFMMKGLAEAEIAELRMNNDLENERTYEAEDALAGTLRQASRVMDMIQHFRFSQNPEGLAAIMGETSTLKESLYQVLHAMSYECPLSRVLVFKMIPNKLPKLKLRTLHLDTILFQLIYNARKAIGDSSGIITIEADERVIGGRPFMRARITDTGIGIAECDMPYVFDPLYSRIDLLRHTISLCITKKLVEVNDGHMEIESSSRGKTCWIELPLAA